MTDFKSLFLQLCLKRLSKTILTYMLIYGIDMTAYSKTSCNNKYQLYQMEEDPRQVELVHRGFVVNLQLQPGSLKIEVRVRADRSIFYTILSRDSMTEELMEIFEGDCSEICDFIAAGNFEVEDPSQLILLIRVVMMVRRFPIHLAERVLDPRQLALERRVEELTGQLRRVEGQRGDLHNIVEELRRQIAEEREQRTQRERKVAKLQQQIQEREIKVATLHKQSKERDAKIIILAEQLAKREKDMTKLQEQSKEKEGENIELVKQLLQRNKKVMTLHKQSKERDAKIIILAEQLAKREKDINKLQQQSKEKEEKNIELGKQLQERDKKVTTLHEQSKEKDAKIVTLQKQLEKREKDINKLQQQSKKKEEKNIELGKQLQESQANITTLQNSVQDSDKANKQLTQTVCALKTSKYKDRQSIQERISSLQQQLASVSHHSFFGCENCAKKYKMVQPIKQIIPTKDITIIGRGYEQLSQQIVGRENRKNINELRLENTVLQLL